MFDLKNFVEKNSNKVIGGAIAAGSALLGVGLFGAVKHRQNESYVTYDDDIETNADEFESGENSEDKKPEEE